MVLNLNKWYLDITSDCCIGFYYVMTVSVAGVRFGASAIYHFSGELTSKSFKLGRTRNSSTNNLLLNNAELNRSSEAVSLRIMHPSCRIDGTWNLDTEPIRRLEGPLYAAGDFQCDWSVAAPFSQVSLRFSDGRNSHDIEGTGYIDHVTMTIPLWTMPFRRLYWGRLHGDHSWIVLLSLETPDGHIGLFADPFSSEKLVSVETSLNTDGTIRSFSWDAGRSQRKVRAQSVRALEDQQVLRRGILGKALPNPWIALGGVDRKYEVLSEYSGASYRGIMEEVVWND
ncbi:MAG: hypothetical protein HN368_15695 [Spirochaetales bacterium]|jgi:hypothetical protein|nr:hypothetical protein [Spirochaetales bacterium]